MTLSIVVVSNVTCTRHPLHRTSVWYRQGCSSKGSNAPANTSEGKRRSTKCSWYQLNRECNFDIVTLKHTHFLTSFSMPECTEAHLQQARISKHQLSGEGNGRRGVWVERGREGERGEGQGTEVLLQTKIYHHTTGYTYSWSFYWWSITAGYGGENLGLRPVSVVRITHRKLHVYTTTYMKYVKRANRSQVNKRVRRLDSTLFRPIC